MGPYKASYGLMRPREARRAYETLRDPALQWPLLMTLIPRQASSDRGPPVVGPTGRFRSEPMEGTALMKGHQKAIKAPTVQQGC